MIRRPLPVVFALLCALAPAQAEPAHILINSADWRAVYSGLLYASLQGLPASFLVSRAHADSLPAILPRNASIRVIASDANVFVGNVAPLLAPQGYADVTEEFYGSPNLALARQLPGISAFIVVDDEYGYHAAAAAPYAASARAYVLFADRLKISAVAGLLRERRPASVLLFGPVDDEVAEALAPFSPEVVNTGDRFEDAIEIAKRFRAQKNATTVYFSNGEYLHADLFRGDAPAIFIGRSHLPDAVREYLGRSGIERGILVGSELYPAATALSRQLGLPVYVKFHAAPPPPTGSLTPAEDTERFRLPRHQRTLELVSAAYNAATGAYEVTVRNPGAQGLHLRHILNFTSPQLVLADSSSHYLESNTSKTTTYAAAPDGSALPAPAAETSLKVSTIFGDAPRSLEFAAERVFTPETTEAPDAADLAPEAVRYDALSRALLVRVRSRGPDAYAAAEAVLIRQGRAVTIGGPARLVPAQGAAELAIPARLTRSELARNPRVEVTVTFGQREGARIKTASSALPLSTTAPTLLVVAAGLLVLSVAILVLFFRKRKRKGPRIRPPSPSPQRPKARPQGPPPDD